MPRLNKIIGLLETKQAAFGTLLANGSYEDALWIGESGYDFAIIDMEHLDFGFPELRNTLQYLLNRGRIAKSGSAAPDVVPLVRVPPNASEMTEWVIKQTLDCGAYGIIQPHLSTVEQARAVVAAVRYPRPGEAERGHRGWFPRHASRYWGLTVRDYYEAAEVWPVSPSGEVFLMGIVEDVEGVKNLRQILKQVKGISAIWAGSGDLSVDMGHAVEGGRHPAVEAAVQSILAACLEHDVPCCVIAGDGDIELRLQQGFRMVVAGAPRTFAALERGMKAAGRGS